MKTCRHSPALRPGFTLVEILVVIAIIGVLIALLMPAVQRMRAEASRTACMNNLRQIGVALQNYHSMHKCFPSNGGWDGTQTIPDTGGAAFTPETFDFTTNKAYQWGVGDPMHGPREQMGSWAFSILPYVEQEAIYLDRDWITPVGIYICPARERRNAATVVTGDAWGNYKSGGWVWSRTDYGCNLHAIENRPICNSATKVGDGTSNTIFVGEKAYDFAVQEKSWYYDESFFLGGSKGTCRGAPNMQPDGPNINYKDNWGSPHQAGVHFLWGDGTVRMLDYGVEPALLAALLTPNGGETVTSP